LLGEANYNLQRIKEAKECWEKALELDPSQEWVKKRLNKLLQEMRIEQKMQMVSNYHFEIHYAKQIIKNKEYRIRDYLEKAYREVGQDFHYFPRYKTVVLIYPREDYKRLIKIGSLGVYDGKIRICEDALDLEEKRLQAILKHEYTHVLIYDLAGGKCPIWLNEGLAQYEEYKDGLSPLNTFYSALKQRKDKLFSLQKLDRAFSSSLPSVIEQAYQQAYCFTVYLIERYGLWRVRKVLEKLKQGKKIEEAFQEVFYWRLEQIEKEWREEKI